MSLYDKASIALIPSGFKATSGNLGKVYSVLPANGDGDFTHSRGSTATRVNKDGLIESVAIGEARLDYPLTNGLVGDCPHLLLEPSRQNRFIRSEEFDNSTWTKTRSSIIANQVTAPDGSNTADELREDTQTGGHYFYDSDYNRSDQNTFSIFAKYKGNNRGLAISFGGSSTGTAYFNLRDGVIETNNADRAVMIKYPNEWYRCVITEDPSSTLDPVFYIYQIGNTSSVSYTGDGSSGIYIWGAQAELASYETSYIPTTSSLVTRSADVCNGSGTSAEFNDTESSLFVEIQGLAEDNINKYIVINDGAGSPYTNSLIIQYRSNGTVRVFHNGLDFEDAIHVSGASFDQTENHKIAVRFKENDMKVYIDGVSQSLNSSFVYQSISGLDEFSFDLNGALPFIGRVKQALVFNEALSDSELETLTS